MGVEYIVTAASFAGLPKEEKHLWHSHVHEVRSGTLIAPGIPQLAEHELMTKLAGTYGKTWHTWHTDQKHALPLGTPMLMMGFTADGQANEPMAADRDRRFEVASPELRERRADIPYPTGDPEADAWSKGIVMPLQAVQLEGQGRASRAGRPGGMSRIGGLDLIRRWQWRRASRPPGWLASIFTGRSAYCCFLLPSFASSFCASARCC